MENLGFDFGLIAVAVSLLGVLAVSLNWSVRYVTAYMNNEDRPKDKVRLKMLLAGLFMLAVGGMLQHE